MNAVDERPAAVSLSEAELLRRLAGLVAAGDIRFEIDRTKLTSIDFPLLVEAEGNRWAYATVIGSALVAWYAGPVGAVVILAAALLAYLLIGRPGIARRLEHRIRTRGLTEVDIWRRLWRFGGVVLVDRDGNRHQGPRDKWTDLVRGLKPPDPANLR